jgi:hypothetical protein
MKLFHEKTEDEKSHDMASLILSILLAFCIMSIQVFHVHDCSVSTSMFATMLTGPRIKADDVITSRCLFLICRGEKYVQYYTIYRQRTESYVRSLSAKNPLLGVVAIIARCKPHSTLVPC